MKLRKVEELINIVYKERVRRYGGRKGGRQVKGMTMARSRMRKH